MRESEKEERTGLLSGFGLGPLCSDTYCNVRSHDMEVLASFIASSRASIEKHYSYSALRTLDTESKQAHVRCARGRDGPIVHLSKPHRLKPALVGLRLCDSVRAEARLFAVAVLGVAAADALGAGAALTTVGRHSALALPLALALAAAGGVCCRGLARRRRRRWVSGPSWACTVATWTHTPQAGRTNCRRRCPGRSKAARTSTTASGCLPFHSRS